MTARCIQRHAQVFFVLAHQREMPLRANLLIVFYTDVCIVAETVGGGLTTNARQQLANNRVINAHHRTAIKRQVVQEVDKRLL